MDKLKIYHNFPYPLRVLLASTRGYYLSWWRYGADTEKLVKEAKNRESWSPRQWRTWQQERLTFVLEHAAKNVPYYQAYWAARRKMGDNASYSYIENWPILKKEQVRQNPSLFLANGCNPSMMFRDNTSGSTGTPLYMYLNRKTVHEMYALFEARVRKWSGVSRKDHWAIMGGQLVVPFEQSSPPYWVLNTGLNQLYLSAHHLSIKTAEAYIKKLEEFQPSHLIVYPSSAVVLANAMLELNLSAPSSIRVIFSNAEPLTVMQRTTMQQAFGCRVVNTYGMAEGVTGAGECPDGRMHFWPEVGYIEVFDDKVDIPVENSSGRFVISSLLNENMPLIRYDVGDRGRIILDSTCNCGCGLPIIDSIDGRSNDLIVTRDGRCIFWINPVFYNLPLRETQVVQDVPGYIYVFYVPAPGFTKETEKIILSRFQDRLGDMEVYLEAVEQIPRLPNGKFRAVISKVNSSGT